MALVLNAFAGQSCNKCIGHILGLDPALIMTKELVIREIRIDEATGWGNSDSRMMSFKVIMPL